MSARSSSNWLSFRAAMSSSLSSVQTLRSIHGLRVSSGELAPAGLRYVGSCRGQRRGEAVKPIIAAAVAAAIASPSLALAEDATYDETTNWQNAWGQTQKDWTDPAET